MKPTEALIFTNLFLSRNSTCFGQFFFPSSGVHCIFSTGIYHASFMTAFKHVQVGTCLKAVIKISWHIPVLNIQWRTPDDGQRNCRNM